MRPTIRTGHTAGNRNANPTDWGGVFEPKIGNYKPGNHLSSAGL
jgi:hypothetical protein